MDSEEIREAQREARELRREQEAERRAAQQAAQPSEPVVSEPQVDNLGLRRIPADPWTAVIELVRQELAFFHRKWEESEAEEKAHNLARLQELEADLAAAQAAQARGDSELDQEFQRLKRKHRV